MPTLTKTALGVVTGLWGHALVRLANGKTRLLRLGEVVHEGDHILTAQNSIVQITEPSGEVRVAGVAPAEAEPAAAGKRPVVAEPGSDLDRVIADLNSGDAQTAPAAGVAGGGDGSFEPGLRVDRISETTSGIALASGADVNSPTFTPATSGRLEASPTPPSNAEPVANAATVAGAEDTATLPVALTGTDPDGRIAAVTVTQLPTGGTLVLADGSAVAAGQVLTPEQAANLGFRPAADLNGTVTLQFTVTDDQGAVSAPASVQINLTPVNDAPVALGETVDSAFNTPVTLNALANDADVDGDALRIGSATLADPSQGTLTVNADNTLTFTPRLGFSGPVTIQYTVLDPSGASAQAVAVVNVATGTPPAITVDAPALGNDSTPTVTGSTSAAPGSTVSLTVTDATGAQHSVTTTVAADGSYRADLPVLPEGGYVVLATVNDNGSGLSANASDTGSIDLTPPSATISLDPVTADNVLNGAEATGTVAITGQAGGDAQPGDTVTLSLNGKSFSGTVGAGGAFSIAVPGSDLAADAGHSVQASITLTDAAGNSTTAAASQGYRVNQAPVAVADGASIGEDAGALTGNATPGTAGQDADPDGDAFSVVGVAAGNATLPLGQVGSTIAGAWGTLVLHADGSYTYTPSAAVQSLAAGQTATDVFSYTVQDAPGDRAGATLTLQVVGANDAAQIGGALSGSVTEDGTLVRTGQLSAADADAGEAGFRVQAGVAGSYGSFSIDAGGTWTYTLDNAAANVQALRDGQQVAESFVVQSIDGTPQTVTVTITGTNDGATIGGTDSATLTEDAGVVAGNLVAGGTLTVTDVDAGEARFAAPASLNGSYGTFTFDPNTGSWTYAASNAQPAVQSLAAGATLTDTLTVSSADGTASHTITVTIVGTNDAAVIGGTATGSVTEDGTALANGTLTVSDVDSAATFTPQTTAGTYGSFTIDAAGNWQYTLNNSAANVQALTSAQHPVETFTVTTADGTTSTVSITVNGANEAPTATVNNISGAEDTSIPVTLAGADVDGSTASFTITALPANGTLLFNGNPVSAGDVIPATGNSASLSFVPAANWNGSTTLSFTATDNEGAGSAVATQSITVTAVNDAPVALADTGSVLENATLNVDAASGLLSNDTDVDAGDSKAVSGIAFGATTGTVGSSLAGTYGTLTLNADGSYSYSASSAAADALPAGQTATDVFTYTVRDAAGATSTSTLTVTITGTNDGASISGTDTATLTEDTGVTAGNLVAGGTLTITDVDAGEAHFAAPASLNGSYGTFSFNTSTGAWSYGAANAQPAIQSLPAGATLTDTLTVSSADGTASHTITVTIVGTNDAAVIGGTATGSVTEDGTTIANGALTASDVDSAATFTPQTTNGTYGSFTIDAAGNWQYTLNNSAANVQALTSSQHPVETFTVTTADGTTSTVSITVNGANEAPTATVNNATGAEDTSIPVTLAGSDIDGSIASFTVTALPANGTLLFNGNPVNTGDVIPATANSTSLSFVPAANWNGGTTVSFTATDNEGAVSAPVSQSITVTPVNDAPVAAPDTGSVNGDAASLSGNVITGPGTDTDVDGDTLSVTAVAHGATSGTVGSGLAGAYGTLTLNADGSYTYTPNAAALALASGATATETFSYSISDGHGGSDTATLAITVTGTDHLPTLTPAVITGTEDSARVLTLADFGYADADGNALQSLTISSLPADGRLQLDTGSGTWVAVSAGQAVSSADIAAGHLRFLPDTNESGSNAYPTAGVGDQRQDYAQFTVVATDSRGGSSSPATVTIDIAPVADAPSLSLGSPAAVAPSAGLRLDYYNASSSINTVNAASAPNLETGLNGEAPDSSTLVTQLPSATSQQAIATGDAYRITGLVYLEAGHSYTLSGYRDDTMYVEIGATPVYSVGYNNWGNFTAAAFTPQASGYYTLEVYVYNGSGPGSFGLQMAVDGGTPQDITTANFGLYPDVASIDASGALHGALVGDADGGHYPVPLNAGLEDSAILLTPISAGLQDVDGSETLAVQVTGVPVGAVLSDGVHSFTATAGSTSANVTGWNLAELKLTPPLNFNGSITLGVTATATETATGATAATSNSFTVTVAPVNDAPVAQPDSGSVAENATLNVNAASGVLANDTDVDSGDSKAVSAVAFGAANGTVGTPLAGTYGTLTLNADGSYSYSANRPAADALAQGQVATETFTYTVRDAAGATSSTTLTFTITGTNDAPVAAITPASGAEDAAGIPVTLSATDVDGNVASFTITALPASGTLLFNGNPVAVGSTIPASANSATLSFVPAANWNGSTSLSFSAIDNLGASSAAVTQGITVSAVNDAPVNSVPASISVTEDTPRAITGISVSDVDAGGAPLSITLSVPGGSFAAASGSGVTVANSGTGAITLTGTAASLNTFIAGSNVVYTPAANANGAVTMTVTTSDLGNTGSGGARSDVDTVTLNIAAVNDAPTQSVPGAQTTAEDTARVFSSANGNAITVADVDGGSLTTTVSVTNGTLTAMAFAGASISGNGSGTVTITGTAAAINGALNGLSYAPAADYNGSATLTVSTSDGVAAPVVSTVGLTVTAVADIVADSITTAEDTPITFNAVTGTNGASADNFENAGRVVTGVTQGAHGSVSFAADGTLVYTPNANYSGSDSFTYTVSSGGVTETATVNVNVTAVNDAPVNTVPASIAVVEDTPVAITGISVNDIDAGSAPLTVSLSVGAGNGVFTAASGSGVTITGSGTTGISLTGTQSAINAFIAASNVTYTPAANANGSVSMTVSTTDLGNTGSGGAKVDTDVVSLNIAAVNDLPLGRDVTITATEDTARVFTTADFLVNDVEDGNNVAPAAVRIDTLPDNGTLFLNGVMVTAGQVVTSAQINAGQLSFEPAFNANGNGYASFTFTVRDSAGGFDAAPNTATINVTAVNDGAPVAGADAFMTTSGTPIVISQAQLLANDVLPDHAQITSVGSASGGTLVNNGNGTYTFTPSAVGSGGFSYTLTDEDGQTSTATVTITTVAPKDDLATVYESALASGTGGGTTQASGNVLTNDGGGTAINSVAGITDGGVGDTDARAGYIGVTTTHGQLVMQSTGAGAGSYTYTLNSAFANNTAATDLAASETFSYTSNAGVTANLRVSVVDDEPLAYDRQVPVSQVPLPSYNLVLVLDVSGSMTVDIYGGEVKEANADGTATITTRLDMAKQAMVELVTEYFNQAQNVSVKLITFSDSATILNGNNAYTDKATLIQAINNITGSGGTNYESALTAEQTAFGNMDLTRNNVSYFLSDGEPTSGNTATALTNFQTYAANNNISSYAVGVGTGISDASALNAIHNVDGDGNGVKDNAIIVPDTNELGSALLSTVPPAFGGNLVASSSAANVLGADGGYLQTVTVRLDSNNDGTPDTDVTFTYNQATNQITQNSAFLSGYPKTSDMLTLNTASGFKWGTLTLNFSTGNYTFYTNGTAQQGDSFTVKYVARDGDGDITPQTTLTFEIENAQPVARPDTDSVMPGATHTDGNVITGLGTDGGLALGNRLASFASQGSGVDVATDNAQVSSIVFKGQTYNLAVSGSGSGAGFSYTVSNGKLTWTGTDGSQLVFTRDGYYDYTPPTAERPAVSYGATQTTQFNTAANAALNGISLSAYSRTGIATGVTNNNPTGTTNDGAGVSGGDNSGRLDNLETLVVTFNQASHPYGVGNVSFAIATGSSSNLGTGGSGALTYTVYDVAGRELGQFYSDASGTVTVPSEYTNIGRIEIEANSAAYTRVTSVSFADVQLNSSAAEVAPVQVGYTLTDDQGDSSSSTLTLNVVSNNLFGTSADDTVTGTNANDRIWGGSGNDTLNGGAGHDIIDGGAGNDSITGAAGNDVLRGGAGNDTLDGGTGNDVLVGGAGNDLLIGGAGSDVFRWEFGDQGTGGAPAGDVVQGFDTAAASAGGDVLDLRDLLQGETLQGSATGNLTSFLHFATVGSDTVIQISTKGGFSGGFNAGAVDQTITLQNVDLTSGGLLHTDQQIIQDLINKSKLLVDGGP